MHAAIEKNSWRLPPEDIVQVADPRSKKVQELVYSDEGEGRNWRSVVLSLLVIGVVIFGIVCAIYVLGYVDELLYYSGRRLVLDQYLRGEYQAGGLQPAWITQRHLAFQADDSSLNLYDAHTDNITRLVENNTIRQLNVKWFQCTRDLKYVLLKHNVKQVFKNTFTALYTIYDVDKDHHIPLRLSSSAKVGGTRLQSAGWCGGSNRLIMIADNDIYVRNSPLDTSDHRVTHTGVPTLVYNGIPDWLYQEDILGGAGESWWCSDSGEALLFASYNDTGVPLFTFPWFDTGGGTGSHANPPPGQATPSVQAFPGTSTLRYPSAGSSNPVVKLWLANLTDLKYPHHELLPPAVFQNQEYYLTSSSWIGEDSNRVAAIWMNRAQNLSVVSNCQPPVWQCVESHVERAMEEGWVDIQREVVFSADGNSFLVTAQVQEGEVDVYTQIKHVTLKEQRIAVISQGKYQVNKILAWDYTNHLVYYLGTTEKKPGQRHVYVVKDPISDKRSRPYCITCELRKYLNSTVKSLYSNCSHFNAYLPPTLNRDGVVKYVIECEGPGVPLGGVHRAATHRLVRVLYNAWTNLGGKLSQLALPSQKTFELKLAHGQKANVQLLLPPSWREELRDAAFPVLVHFDGRPGSESVSGKYNIDWGTYMSSQFDVVYVRIDVVGSVGEGSRSANRRLSGKQIQDHILAVRYLFDLYKYLDRTRIAVWGRGYGGYVTSMALSSQHKIFKCGIAISPITDWIYYNSAFTERILGVPSENYKLYVEVDATQHCRHIEDKALYLVHGVADLSVPYVHSVALARTLSQAGILFRYQSYADEGHDLGGVLEHLYHSMEDFLSQCLNLEKNEQMGI